MNPLENIKLKISSEIHNNLPKKWKKVGDIIILDLKNIDKNKRNKIAKFYAEELGAKTIIQKRRISGELRKPGKVEILYGKETTTVITEYGISYKLGWLLFPPYFRTIFHFHFCRSVFHGHHPCCILLLEGAGVTSVQEL